MTAASGFALSCSGAKGDSVVLAGDGSRLSSEEIDRDPLALLPSGAVALVHIDARAAARSDLGRPGAKLLSAIFPLGAESNFDAQRDVERALIGLYSFSGADMAIVLQGSFDPNAIRAAASRQATTAFGVPLSRLEYANNDLFVAGDVGFVVVTHRTVVAGNSTGIRRTLDRIRDKRLRREMPEWMQKLIDEPKASIVGVGDLSSEPQVAAAAQQVPFLAGLTVTRVLGNFEPPGLNLAGALTYSDPAAAEKGRQGLDQVRQLAGYTSLLAMFGLPAPVRDIQVRTENNDVQFIAAIDAAGAAALMELAVGSARR